MPQGTLEQLTRQPAQRHIDVRAARRVKAKAAALVKQNKVVMGIDYDSCGAEMFRKKVDLETGAVLEPVEWEINTECDIYIAIQAEIDAGNQIILMTFSNRQSPLLDEMNHERNQNGLSMENYELLTQHFNEGVAPDEQPRVVFDEFRLSSLPKVESYGAMDFILPWSNKLNLVVHLLTRIFQFHANAKRIVLMDDLGMPTDKEMQDYLTKHGLQYLSEVIKHYKQQLQRKDFLTGMGTLLEEFPQIIPVGTEMHLRPLYKLRPASLEGLRDRMKQDAVEGCQVYDEAVRLPGLLCAPSVKVIGTGHNALMQADVVQVFEQAARNGLEYGITGVHRVSPEMIEVVKASLEDAFKEVASVDTMSVQNSVVSEDVVAVNPAVCERVKEAGMKATMASAEITPQAIDAVDAVNDLIFEFERIPANMNDQQYKGVLDAVRYLNARVKELKHPEYEGDREQLLGKIIRSTGRTNNLMASYKVYLSAEAEGGAAANASSEEDETKKATAECKARLFSDRGLPLETINLFGHVNRLKTVCKQLEGKIAPQALADMKEGLGYLDMLIQAVQLSKSSKSDLEESTGKLARSINRMRDEMNRHLKTVVATEVTAEAVMR